MKKHRGWWNDFDGNAQDLISKYATRKSLVVQACQNLDVDGCDFVVPEYRQDGLKAGFRVRSWEKRGGFDFTTRWPHETNRFLITDPQQAIDVLLYGVAPPGRKPPMVHGWILRLDVWRDCLLKSPPCRLLDGSPFRGCPAYGNGPFANGDGTYFMRWAIRRFPGALVGWEWGKPAQQGLPLAAQQGGFTPYD